MNILRYIFLNIKNREAEKRIYQIAFEARKANIILESRSLREKNLKKSKDLARVHREFYKNKDN